MADNEIEKRLSEEEADRLEADRKRWIIERKKFRRHFKDLQNLGSAGMTLEEVWDKIVKPDMEKEKGDK